MNTRFEWDEAKAASNVRKHGVTFQFAQKAFLDPYAIRDQDRVENWEARWSLLAMIDGVQILVVAHTIWDEDDGEVIRIISARNATPRERRRYAENRSIRF